MLPHSLNNFDFSKDCCFYWYLGIYWNRAQVFLDPKTNKAKFHCPSAINTADQKN